MDILRRVRASMLCALLVGSFIVLPSAFGFEGLITATLTRGDQAGNLLYTVGTNYLRIERLETNWPHARDIVNLQSGEITLLFPHNRSFVRLKVSEESPSTMPPGISSMGIPSSAAAMGPAPDSPRASIGPTNLPGVPSMPQSPGGMPQGIGPRPGNSTAVTGMPPGIGQQAGPSGGMAALPAMPMMPMPPMMAEKMELVQTNGTTNILGLTCSRYELRQRGEEMEIWATDKLFPFRPYLGNQPHRFGPRMIAEQWSGLVADRHLFPLLAVLRFENGPERLRWEVTSVTPEKIKEEDEVTLFTPPPEYHEIQQLSF